MKHLQPCLPATIFLIISLGNLLLSMGDGKVNFSYIPYIVMYAAVLQLLCTYNHTRLAWAILLFVLSVPILLLIIFFVMLLVFGIKYQEIQEIQKRKEK